MVIVRILSPVLGLANALLGGSNVLLSFGGWLATSANERESTVASRLISGGARTGCTSGWTASMLIGLMKCRFRRLRCTLSFSLTQQSQSVSPKPVNFPVRVHFFVIGSWNRTRWPGLSRVTFSLLTNNSRDVDFLRLRVYVFQSRIGFVGAASALKKELHPSDFVQN